MLLYKKKKYAGSKANRLLISVRVHGSAGPIRFVVKDNDVVAAVIHTALKSYARERRLPILGSDVKGFVLYSQDVDRTLSPWQTIGSTGSWNFILCKNPINSGELNSGALMSSAKRCGSWFDKSFSNFRVSTH